MPFGRPLGVLWGSFWALIFALGSTLGLLGAIWGPKVTKEFEKYAFSIDFDVVFDAKIGAKSIENDGKTI